eukprot:747313-Hanusia_phi.AAC.1
MASDQPARSRPGPDRTQSPRCTTGPDRTVRSASGAARRGPGPGPVPRRRAAGPVRSWHYYST